jgi:hypothetical protein
MARTSSPRGAWVAVSAQEAVVDILTKRYLNNDFEKTEDYIVGEAIDKYVECETKTYFNTTQIMIALLRLRDSGVIKEYFDRYKRRLYGLSATTIGNIRSQWKACSRYHQPQVQTAIPPSRHDCKSAYEKEKERQNTVAASKKVKRQTNHWVYYIQWDNDPGFVKIGYSSSPKDRIPGFLTGSPRKLKVLRLEPVASAQEEFERHQKFNQYQHKREWFRYEGQLKEYIDSLSVEPAVKLWDVFPASAKGEIEVECF